MILFEDAATGEIKQLVFSSTQEKNKEQNLEHTWEELPVHFYK